MLRLTTKLFLLIGFCIGLSELCLRTVLETPFRGLNRLENFYAPAEEFVAEGPVDYLFVGTSRVAGSVSPQVIATTLSDSLKRPIRVVNVGKGYSTLVMHYYGLRRLYQKQPNHMHGALVMIEAPSGIPLYQDWDEDWTTERWPTLLGPFLTSDNLLPFLLRSPNSLQAKATAVAAAPLRAVRFARYIHPALEEKVNDRFDFPAEEGPVADLSNAGGIRTDSAGVALVRKGVKEESREEAVPSQRQQWEGSVIASILQLVRSHGGDVIFFEMPESSYQSLKHQPDLYSVRKSTFHQWAQKRGLRLMEFPDFSTTDADFPDLLHMRASRSTEYSRLISMNLLATNIHPGRRS